MTGLIRTCLACGQADDHPRHVVDVGGGITSNFHMDCHVITTDCEICKAQLDGVGGVKGNPKGDALREHLASTGPGSDQPGWTAPADDESEASSDTSKKGATRRG